MKKQGNMMILAAACSAALALASCGTGKASAALPSFSVGDYCTVRVAEEGGAYFLEVRMTRSTYRVAFPSKADAEQVFYVDLDSDPDFAVPEL